LIFIGVLLASAEDVAALSSALPGARFIGMAFDFAKDEYRVLPVIFVNESTSNGVDCDYQGCQVIIIALS